MFALSRIILNLSTSYKAAKPVLSREIAGVIPALTDATEEEAG